MDKGTSFCCGHDRRVVNSEPCRKPAVPAEKLCAAGRARGAIAQLVERFVRNEEVRGSNPLSSTWQSKDQLPCKYLWRCGITGVRLNV